MNNGSLMLKIAMAMLLAFFTAPAFTAPRTGHLNAAPSATAPASFSAPETGSLVDLPDGAKAYLPAGAGKNGPAPMLLLFHGTGGTGSALIEAFRPYADRDGIVLLALTSRGENWDSVDLFFDDYEAGKRPRDGQWTAPKWGKDAERVDAALAALFARVPIDPKRVGVAGFSHGASYALMVGTANPQLFSTIIALSPGILIIGDPPGGQNVFVSHGTTDKVQPYKRTEEVFLPRLVQLGYRVTFQSFVGGHGIPAEVLARAIRLFLDGAVVIKKPAA
jgi:phospholipase/carboxylesterase